MIYKSVVNENMIYLKIFTFIMPPHNVRRGWGQEKRILYDIVVGKNKNVEVQFYPCKSLVIILILILVQNISSINHYR